MVAESELGSKEEDKETKELNPFHPKPKKLVVSCSVSNCRFSKNDCCDSTFKCLPEQKREYCVYKPSQVNTPDPNFCTNQAEKCYFCCFNNSCNNQQACDTYRSDMEENSYLIFGFHVGMFFLFIMYCFVFYSYRLIRLNNYKAIKDKHMKSLQNVNSIVHRPKRSDKKLGERLLQSEDKETPQKATPINGDNKIDESGRPPSAHPSEPLPARLERGHGNDSSSEEADWFQG